MGANVLEMDVFILSFELIIVCALLILNVFISRKKKNLIEKMEKEQEQKKEKMLHEILMNHKRG